VSIISIFPSKQLGSPLDTFAILILNQGLERKTFGSMAAAVWSLANSEAPLSQLFVTNAKYGVSIFYDDAPPDFQIKQIGSQLTLDVGLIMTYLGTKTINWAQTSYDAKRWS
jgi:hypothetical protein